MKELKVDPAALRAAANMMRDIASRVRQVDVDVAADTLPAARAFNGWRSGDALANLAQFWHREFAALAVNLDRLSDELVTAAVNYAAADQDAHARLLFR